MAAAHTIEKLWDAMTVLTGHQERTLYLMYWHGLTEEEIALLHNCSQQSVHKSLTASREKIQKYFHGGLFFGGSQTVVHVREKNGAVGHGNGQRPVSQSNTYKTPASTDRPAVSLNPSPEIYLGSPERSEFMDALAHCCASAFKQVCPATKGRDKYFAAAAKSRARIQKARCEI